MSERFKIELVNSYELVGIRVTAKYHDYPGPSADLKVTGNLSPDDAIAFADALRTKAEEVKAKNAKREAEERRRRERRAKLPSISL